MHRRGRGEEETGDTQARDGEETKTEREKQQKAELKRDKKMGNCRRKSLRASEGNKQIERQKRKRARYR